MNYNGQIFDGNENTAPSRIVLPAFEEGGVGSLMFKRISSLNIGYKNAAEAFNDIMSTSRNMRYIRPCDLLDHYDLSCLRKNPSARDGEAILIISGTAPNAETARELSTHSVSGIYRLISRTNGFAIDMLENEYQNIESARFYFCKSKSADSTAALIRSWGMYARVIGIAGGERVCISVDSQIRMDILKSELLDGDDLHIDITDRHAEYFNRSFGETAVFSSLDAARSARHLNIGYDGDLPSLVASLLGVYAACRTYGIGLLRTRYHIGHTVAVRSDIAVCDGMTVSLFDPVDISCGRTTSQSLSYMNAVLRGLIAGGEITCAMPVRGTVEETLLPVLQDGAVFVKEKQCPDTISHGAVLALGKRATGNARIGHINKPSEQTL